MEIDRTSLIAVAVKATKDFLHSFLPSTFQPSLPPLSYAGKSSIKNVVVCSTSVDVKKHYLTKIIFLKLKTLAHNMFFFNQKDSFVLLGVAWEFHSRMLGWVHVEDALSSKYEVKPFN